MVRIPGFHCPGPGSIPGRGTEIPYKLHGVAKKKKKKQNLFLIRDWEFMQNSMTYVHQMEWFSL